jgi:hypothetical protein
MRKDNIYYAFKTLIHNFLLIIILFSYLLISCLLSDKIYLSVIKDIFNVIILLSILLMLIVFIRDSKDLILFCSFFKYLIITFALIISVERIYSFLYLSSYSDFYNDYYKHIEKAIVDRNFALLPVFFGMVTILSIFYREISNIKKLFYTFLLLVYSFSIFLSCSRRGVFLFLLIYLMILVIKVWSIFDSNLKFKHLLKNSKYFLISILLFFFILFLVVSKTSVYFKNRVLANIGITNISYTKNLITSTTFRYIHLFNKSLLEDSLYARIWRPVLDSKDPEAWWGNGNYRIARNLTGKNVEIIPAVSKGYLLDSTCLGFSSDYHSYYFLMYKEESVNMYDSLITSVYCYASEDFDGNAVALRTDGSLIGNPDMYYNLSNKGCWQKLKVPLSCYEGNIKIYFYMNKGGVKDFSQLKGYVIFAYPEIHRLSNNGTSSSSSRHINNESKVQINSNEVCNLNLVIEDTLKIQKNIGKAGFSNFYLSFLISQIESVNNKDPIRNWIAKIVSEDTTYHGYKANLIFKKPNDNFGEDRTTLWKFALEIFNKEYNWHQKIFGGGFNFLNWYGYCFSGDKTKTEYPHNPFLHILLYSGLLGLSIYLLFMYKGLYYYIKYSKEYPVIFIFYLITFYFTFFSGGNPFDPPLMGFFVMLPFFIHHIQKKDNSVPQKTI